MEILWICGSRILGGAERVTIQLAGLLRERGHAVSVLCPPGGELPPALARERLAALPGEHLGRRWDLRAARDIARAVAEVRPAVAMVTTSDEWVWSCLAKRQATRLVLVRHMALRLPWTVRYLADRRADAVVAVSETVWESLTGRFAIGAGRIHVIPNPVRFEPRRDLPAPGERIAARAALKLPPTGRWAGFFAGMEERKGVGDAVAAVARANQALGDVHLLICGRVPDQRNGPALGEWSKAVGLEGRIHWLGWTEDVARAITAVDAVLVATRSELKEGLPLVPLEAMACGTPVVAYATGGVGEAIGADGLAGRVVSPDDAGELGRALIEVLADPEAARQIAIGGLQRVRECYDSKTAADRYEHLFATLLAAAL